MSEREAEEERRMKCSRVKCLRGRQRKYKDEFIQKIIRRFSCTYPLEKLHGTSIGLIKAQAETQDDRHVRFSWFTTLEKQTSLCKLWRYYYSNSLVQIPPSNMRYKGNCVLHVVDYYA